MNYARLTGLDVRLSRLDFDIDRFNRPEIVFYNISNSGEQ